MAEEWTGGEYVADLEGGGPAYIWRDSAGNVLATRTPKPPSSPAGLPAGTPIAPTSGGGQYYDPSMKAWITPQPGGGVVISQDKPTEPIPAVEPIDPDNPSEGYYNPLTGAIVKPTAEGGLEMIRPYLQQEGCDVVELTTGEAVDRTTFESLPIKYQNALYLKGIDAYNEWFPVEQEKDALRILQTGQGDIEAGIAQTEGEIGISNYRGYMEQDLTQFKTTGVLGTKAYDYAGRIQDKQEADVIAQLIPIVERTGGDLDRFNALPTLNEKIAEVERLQEPFEMRLQSLIDSGKIVRDAEGNHSFVGLTLSDLQDPTTQGMIKFFFDTDATDEHDVVAELTRQAEALDALDALEPLLITDISDLPRDQWIEQTHPEAEGMAKFEPMYDFSRIPIAEWYATEPTPTITAIATVFGQEAVDNYKNSMTTFANEQLAAMLIDNKTDPTNVTNAFKAVIPDNKLVKDTATSIFSLQAEGQDALKVNETWANLTDQERVLVAASYGGDRSFSDRVKQSPVAMMTPLGLYANWDDYNLGEKIGWTALEIVGTLATVGAVGRAAIVGARSIGTASKALRISAAAKAVGAEIEAQIIAPFSMLAHPVQTVKGTLRLAENSLENLFNWKKVAYSVLSTSDSTIRIRLGKDLTQAQALAVRKAFVESGKSIGDDLTVKFFDAADNLIGEAKLPRSPLMKMVGGGVAHATPMWEKFAEEIAQTGKAMVNVDIGKDAMGLFVSLEPHARFATASAYGLKGTTPAIIIWTPESAAAKATQTTTKIYKHMVEMEGNIAGGTVLFSKMPEQILFTRVGINLEKVLIIIEGKPLTVAQIMKLRALGLIEGFKAPFRPPIMFKGTGLADEAGEAIGMSKALDSVGIERLTTELVRSGNASLARSVGQVLRARLVGKMPSDVIDARAIRESESDSLTRLYNSEYDTDFYARIVAENPEAFRVTDGELEYRVDEPDAGLRRMDTPDEISRADRPDEIDRTTRVEEPTRSDRIPEPGLTTERIPREPTQPERPSRPSEPSRPSRPDEPSRPSRPEEPDRPSRPDEPSRPSRPDEPDRPDRPSKKTTPTIVSMPTDDISRLNDVERAGAVAWKQGWCYKLIYPPYGQDNIINSKTPFPDMAIHTGAQSALRSLQARGGGKLPATIKRDMGIMDIHIVTGREGSKPKIRFTSDRNQRTDITPKMTGMR